MVLKPAIFFFSLQILRGSSPPTKAGINNSEQWAPFGVPGWGGLGLFLRGTV